MLQKDNEVGRNTPWVIYRLPNEKHFNVLRGGEWMPYQPSLDETLSNTQFVIRAFNKAGHHLALNGAEELSDSLEWLDDWRVEGSSTGVLQSKEEIYQNGVQAALEAFEKGTFSKLVLARTQAIAFEKKCIAEILRHIATQAPAAFVYAAYFPQNQTIWAGASPELLVQKSGLQVETVALAGTRYSALKSPFSPKEYHEQDVVARDLAEILSPFGKLTVSTTHPIAVSGGLTHLEANALLYLNEDTPWQTLAEALHPTPAVGGYPLGHAVEAWLAAQEPFDRQYYAGYLGPVYPNGDAKLFVNIRCGRFDEAGLTLFAGAGLVAGSDPEAEWLETEAKIAAIRACFGV